MQRSLVWSVKKPCLKRNRKLFDKPKSLDRNKRIIKEFVFLFHPSPPLFSHLAAVRVSPQPAMTSTQTLQYARNKDEAEWKSNDLGSTNRAKVFVGRCQNGRRFQSFAPFTRLTIKMLASYRPYIGSVTRQHVNMSGGVIKAATTAMRMKA